ncbi:LysR family transcriptional regulator [Achromobacter mucicolens]|jgi:DNA-binding transcriptional LysR family regulator|uniref:LysR family transcriptional regulator n=1 Tax=Achromobacter mucicolens TaxID=1389922 RepID=A0ABD4Z039_9BURK|nr:MULTISPECIES: LysR family transcriptional regulator [Achromobacter]KXJ64833.1 LysR family transcriptional regulator [Achromobacter xylosoxidans]OXC88310.1 LysR family transcriptional regulator [Achromobacter sp. KAs 3-5]MCU6619670.1 LysR family transcriptional regulator [Achromobacter mucicolens]MDH1181025.1 LysR family transcriptional regulator [Achromobacter mucicolens]MDH1524681.1 LysR family transcriptional regulator [Achromobacter mucicolens]
MNLKDVDLNLLVVFNELHKHGRVSAAAESLGISQPGVSNALARLRKLLGDELFLRTSRGMVPTPYAESLAQPIADALAALHGTLNARVAFDPARSERAFVIGVNDVGETYFLPRLMRALDQVAPGVTIRTVRTTSIDVRDEMERGRMDLAMGFLPGLKGGFFQRRLFRQPYVCIFRQDHPLARSGVSARQFRAAEHVAIVSEGTGHGVVDEVIARAGIRRRLRLTVPHFMAVGPVLQATDMIAVVPQRFADCACGPFGLASAPCPVKIPESVINVFWHARNHREAANQWLRQVVVDVFAD